MPTSNDTGRYNDDNIKTNHPNYTRNTTIIWLCQAIGSYDFYPFISINNLEKVQSGDVPKALQNIRKRFRMESRRRAGMDGKHRSERRLIMGRLSTISALPTEVVIALNQRIIEGRYINTELSDWLSEQGHNMSLEAVMDYSRMVKRSVKESDPLRLRFGLSPATLAKHLKDLETLTALLVTQYRTNEHIKAIEDAIRTAELEHKTQSANDNQGGA